MVCLQVSERAPAAAADELELSNVIAADWSPDGREIAMVRTGSRPDALELWTVYASGTDAHLLSQDIPGTDATVDW